MKQIEKRRSTWRAGIGLSAAVLAVVGLWVVWPRERLLMQVGHPVAQVDLSRESIAWVSANQLLVVTTDQNGSEARDSIGVHRKINWQGSVDLLNTTTHSRTHLAALTSLLNHTTVFPMVHPDFFEMSPDGVWLMWRAHFEGKTGSISHVAQLDGSFHREWRSDDTSESLFLNSRYVFQTSGMFTTATFIDLLDPSKDHRDSEKEPVKAIRLPSNARQPVFLVVSPTIEEGKKPFVEIETYRTEDQIGVKVALDNKDDDGPSPVQTREVPLPNGTVNSYDSVALISPQQKAICYNLWVARTPVLLGWLHQLFSKWEAEPKITEEIWIGSADGRQMHKMGYFPLTPDFQGSFSSPLRDLRWLPDGKQISFVYDGRLYVAPAEPVH